MQLLDYGIQGSLLQWLKYFFADRTHQTKVGCCISDATAIVTHHDLTRYYCYLISSNVKILTYFCVRNTAPVSTHCTASTRVGRGPIGCHISFP